jgi:hypothetical protein
MPLPCRSDSGKSRLGPASRDVCPGSSRRKASSFCLAPFYGTAVFFVEGDERSERNEHVENVNENKRISAGVTYLSESWDQTRRTNGARSLADQWAGQSRPRTKTGHTRRDTANNQTLFITYCREHKRNVGNK